MKYRNHNEEIDRYTTRATRQLIKIYAVEELELEELHSTVLFVDMKFKMQHMTE